MASAYSSVPSDAPLCEMRGLAPDFVATALAEWRDAAGMHMQACQTDGRKSLMHALHSVAWLLLLRHLE